MLNEKIKFEDRFESEEYNTVTFYFIAPKEMLKDYDLNKEYPDAVSMEINIECLKDNIDVEHAIVSVSPTIEVDGDGYKDCDWYSANNMTDEEIDRLLKLALKGGK